MKAKNPTSNPQSQRLPHKFLVSSLVVLTILVVILTAQITLWERIYPGISVASLSLSGLKPVNGEQLVAQVIKKRVGQRLTLSYNNQIFKLDLSDLATQTDLADKVAQAFALGHGQLYFKPINIGLNYQFNTAVTTQIEQIAKAVNNPAHNATIGVQNETIVVNPSTQGQILDQSALKWLITAYLNSGVLSATVLPMVNDYPKLTTQQADQIKTKLELIQKNSLTLTFDDQSWKITPSVLLGFIDLDQSQSNLLKTSLFNISEVSIGAYHIRDQKISLSNTRVEQYLKTLATEIDQPVKEPVFSYEGTKVLSFVPPQDGLKLDLTQNSQKLIYYYDNLEGSSSASKLALIVDRVPPTNKLSNEFGVKELVGQGKSLFAGSIVNRIYNIGLASSKINGILIKPREVFSFNNTVGDITAASGFKQAYVIKSGRTVLDDGGGVCQVSTTLFRAALNAGLPIVTRTAHAYRVGYYEQSYPPGLDATIFYPSVDFQFKNDTDHYLLIQTEVVGVSLTINLFGTSDGRKVAISNPKVLSQTPPLPEIRQDDPTLAKGQIKQVDWPAWGAKVIFDRTVTKNGQAVINETFTSNYRSWQAVYLVGTKES